MKSDKENLLLYAVTDRGCLGEKPLAAAVGESIDGGVTFVQLREKHLDTETFIKEAREIKALCESRDIPFVINDSIETAEAVDADGVHVGQDDTDVKTARMRLGKNKIIGVSVQTVEQAISAENDGADYLGVGAVFYTSSKDDAQNVSLETLKAICSAVSIPVIAIGGITAENAATLRGSGVCGIAVISAIFAKKNITRAARELRCAAESMVGE